MDLMSSRTACLPAEDVETEIGVRGVEDGAKNGQGCDDFLGIASQNVIHEGIAKEGVIQSGSWVPWLERSTTERLCN